MTPPRPATALFCALLGAASVALVGLHTTTGGRDALLRRFHLRPASTAEWAALQPLPGMYNFANRAWTSRRPVAWADLEDDPQAYGGRYINHYPTRVVTFVSSRAAWGQQGCPDYLYVESAVRGQVLRSRFRLDRDGDRLVMSLDRSGDPQPCTK